MANLHTIIVGAEWAHIVTDEETGLFVAHGSFGTFAHCWPPRGRRRTLHEFLAGLGFDYFMTKTRAEDSRRFDFDATVKAMKGEIRRHRREKGISTTAARDAWDELDALDETDSQDAFVTSLSDDLMDALGDDWWMLIQHGPSPECTEFWRILWPAYLQVIAPAKEEA